MSSRSASANIAKFIIFLFALALFLFLLYWLWQRQPKSELAKKVESKIETIQSAVEQKDESEIDPPATSVLSQKEIKIRGKTSPDSYVLLYSDSNQKIAVSDQVGSFESGFELENGLNQIEIVSLNKKDLKENSSRQIEYYLKTEKEKLTDKSYLYSGSVKTIFDTLLSINSSSGEKKIQTKKTTELVFPEDEEEKSATASALSAVRIGDYIIAIGTIDKEELMNAQKLTVLRENKPQINKNFSAVKILKEPKSNLFSATDFKDNKLSQFTITKNSELIKEDKDAVARDIVKDKRAIIIFEKDDDRLVAAFVYLLP